MKISSIIVSGAAVVLTACNTEQPKADCAVGTGFLGYGLHFTRQSGSSGLYSEFNDQVFSQKYTDGLGKDNLAAGEARIALKPVFVSQPFFEKVESGETNVYAAVYDAPATDTERVGANWIGSFARDGETDFCKSQVLELDGKKAISEMTYAARTAEKAAPFFGTAKMPAAPGGTFRVNYKNVRVLATAEYEGTAIEGEAEVFRQFESGPAEAAEYKFNGVWPMTLCDTDAECSPTLNDERRALGLTTGSGLNIEWKHAVYCDKSGPGNTPYLYGFAGPAGGLQVGLSGICAIKPGLTIDDLSKGCEHIVSTLKDSSLKCDTAAK